MPKYKLPAVEGKITVEGFSIPKGVKVKSWNSFGDVVVIETDKEIDKLKDYKIE